MAAPLPFVPMNGTSIAAMMRRGDAAAAAPHRDAARGPAARHRRARHAVQRETRRPDGALRVYLLAATIMVVVRVTQIALGQG